MTAEKKLAEALAFIADFAGEQFQIAPAQFSATGKQLDPLTDALWVWVWQRDAAALLGKINA